MFHIDWYKGQYLAKENIWLKDMSSACFNFFIWLIKIIITYVTHTFLVCTIFLLGSIGLWYLSFPL